MKTQLRNGLQTGLAFWLISAFLFLIGFTDTAAVLFGDIIHDEDLRPGFGLTTGMVNMLFFLGLLGIWAGARAARAARAPGEALAAGIAAGLVHGLGVGGLAWLVGTLHESKVRMSTYLAQLLPETIQLFVLEKAPAEAAAWHFVLLLATGFAGGLLGFFLGRPGWREAIAAGWRQLSSHAGSLSTLQRIRASRAFGPSLAVLGIIVLFTLPLRLDQYWNYTLGTVGIYVLLGLGLNIVVGLAGLLDLGYVAFFAVGAYTVALLTAPAPHKLLWSFWVALPIGVLLAALAGVLLGIPVLRMRGDYLAIVTLGFGEIIRILSRSDILTGFTGGPKGVLNIGGPQFMPRLFSNEINFLYLILLCVFLAIFITVRLQHSRIGRAWEAMREDETVAGAMGINTLQYKLLAFAIGAAFAGLGGVLFASRNQFTGPEDHNLMVSINVLAVVIVGGMGSIPGVIAGAFVLKGLPEVLREMEDYRIVLFGALLVIMMLIRPEGLLPSSRRKLEVHQQDPNQPDEPIRGRL